MPGNWAFSSPEMAKTGQFWPIRAVAELYNYSLMPWPMARLGAVLIGKILNYNENPSY